MNEHIFLNSHKLNRIAFNARKKPSGLGFTEPTWLTEDTDTYDHFRKD